MNYSKIAVLMPVYNGEKFLKKQISSIFNQKDVKVTIFVSIDKSTDNSLELIKSLKKKFNSIEIFSENLRYGSPTKNYFHLISNFRLRDFDYISLSDQDDIWYPNKLSKSVEILKKKKFSIYSSSVNAKFKSSRKYIKKSGVKTQFDYYFESAGPGSTYVFNRKFFQNFQNYLSQNLNKLQNFEHYDWLIYAYAREKNFAWYLDSEPTLDYVQHDKNFTGANIGIKSFIIRLKEVINGTALKKANDLSNILELKKIGIKDFHSLKSSIKLFLLSFSLRRSLSNKFFISIYFFLLILFGKNNNGKRILSFQRFINYIIFIVFFLFFFKNFDKEIFSSITNNIDRSLYVLIASFLSLLIISFRIITTCNFFSNTKFSFLSWHKFFCESQIMNYLIPFSGIVYRGYLLNKSIKLNYINYTKILIYLNILELLLITSTVLILTFYLNRNYQIFFLSFITFIPIFYTIISKNFALFNLNFLNNIKLFKRINSKNYQILNLYQSIEITFYTVLKIIFNYFIFFTIFLLLDLDINYVEILILTLINQIFEPIKITPQNIGLTEAAFALFFSTVNNEPIIGSYIKIIHRSFEIFNYFVYFVFYKVINSNK